MNGVAPILLVPVPILVVVGLYLLFWQAYKFRHRVSGFARWSLVVTVVADQFPPVIVRLADAGDLGSPSAVAIIANACLVLPTVGLACFRLALLGRSARDPSVRTTIAAGAALVATIVVLGLTAVGRGAPLTFDGSAVRAGTDDAAAAFYVVSTVGYGAVLLYVGVWFFSFTRGRSDRLRRGMRIAAVGELGLGVGVLVRGVPPVVVFLGGPPTPAELSVPVLALTQYITMILVAGGLSYPLVASRLDALAAWSNYRADFRRLGPLWETGREAFPEIERRPAAADREPLRFRFLRRRTECFDHLHRLRFSEPTARASGSEAAREILRAGVALYESRHEVDDLWSVLDEHEDSAGTTDLALLNDLSDCVEEVRRLGPRPGVRAVDPLAHGNGLAQRSPS